MSGGSDELAEQAAVIGALAEPARRALYLHVVAQPEAVSREQAARAVDLPLHSAKFHLDRLVDEGLLDVEFRRLSGRSGPGAGRPSKLYRRSERLLAVSLPPRRYDLVGELLAAGIERATREAAPVDEAVRGAARDEGRRLARQAEVDDREPPRARTASVLARHGYEPRVSDEEICLANCPFDRLAKDHTELVCGMNLALVEGVLDGLGAEELTARLEPEPGSCCVKVHG
jgi:predicted ArsR family transcriptional regulator